MYALPFALASAQLTLGPDLSTGPCWPYIEASDRGGGNWTAPVVLLDESTPVCADGADLRFTGAVVLRETYIFPDDCTPSRNASMAPPTLIDKYRALHQRLYELGALALVSLVPPTHRGGPSYYQERFFFYEERQDEVKRSFMIVECATTDPALVVQEVRAAALAAMETSARSQNATLSVGANEFASELKTTHYCLIFRVASAD